MYVKMFKINMFILDVWTFFCYNCRVATLSKRYFTAKGIISESLKLIGQQTINMFYIICTDFYIKIIELLRYKNIFFNSLTVYKNVKNQHFFNSMYGLFCQIYRVATLKAFYLTVLGIKTLS